MILKARVKKLSYKNKAKDLCILEEMIELSGQIIYVEYDEGTSSFYGENVYRNKDNHDIVWLERWLEFNIKPIIKDYICLRD